MPLNNMNKTYLAQISNPVINSLNANNPTGATSSLLQVIISTLLLVASVYFFIYFVLGGISFITSEGDKNNLDLAKNRITYAFIGLFVTLSVYAVTSLVGRIFGIPGLQNFSLDIPHL